MAGPTRTAERRGRREGAPAPRQTRATGPAGEPAARRLRLPGRRALLPVAAVAVCAGFAVWALYGSSWFRVEQVSVDGTRVLTERQVRAAAGVPLGTPLASVDTARVEQRVRTALRRVAEVRVERSWPGGIGVKVTERKPELVLEKAGKYVEVDAGGVRFAAVGKPPGGVPLLRMEARRSPSARAFPPAALRRAAATVVTALPGPVREETRVVRVRSYDSVTVELTGGRTVLWGGPGHGAAKARALTALRKAAKDARHFDVSVPSAPAVSGS
ncbi:FtsQ-type POTRA domain-containing protein [Streptomyces sp. JJ36]|uniref:cell division protein FtsQ/DivIB n=1 Tax=Streptomyces sp. JJ36 TaxID=2736645 RepID=UPI001F31307F|nr:FtsQ-type POTRA domain-containing protein [Streptomyces sp. JJ36]MCF6523029.1 FtsQ-type POTRA domain-containing protein [Streptomyces sp. JJ36]